MHADGTHKNTAICVFVLTTTSVTVMLMHKSFNKWIIQFVSNWSSLYRVRRSCNVGVTAVMQGRPSSLLEKEVVAIEQSWKGKASARMTGRGVGSLLK